MQSRHPVNHMPRRIAGGQHIAGSGGQKPRQTPTSRLQAAARPAETHPSSPSWPASCPWPAHDRNMVHRPCCAQAKPPSRRLGQGNGFCASEHPGLNLLLTSQPSPFTASAKADPSLNLYEKPHLAASHRPSATDLYAAFTPNPRLRHSPLTRGSGKTHGSIPEHTMSDLIYLSLTFAAFGGCAALIRILDRL